MQRAGRNYKDLKQKQNMKSFIELLRNMKSGMKARILKDIQSGITLETLIAKKYKKMPEEKAAVAKQKKQQRRAKRKKEARNNLTPEEIFYDDRFFFIAGHTTGGAPYGVTWLPVVTYVEILIYRRASLDRCFGTFALKRLKSSVWRSPLSCGDFFEGLNYAVICGKSNRRYDSYI